MSLGTPPPKPQKLVPLTLQELTSQSLLRNEALAISALEDIPQLLFLPLFKDAFKSTQTNILKAMVLAWPFPCLPMGALMKRRNTYTEIMQAVLDGIDMLLAQKVHSRRCKLAVLDLRNGLHNSWTMKSAALEGDCFQRLILKNLAARRHLRTRSNQPFKVVMSLCLRDSRIDCFIPDLLSWEEQRRGLLQLCFASLQFWTMSHHDYRPIFEISDPALVQEVSIRDHSPDSLLCFVPYLGLMRNLRKVYLGYIFNDVSTSPERKQHIITLLASKFLKLKHLQTLSVESVPFLEGHLDKLLRNLKTSLHGLSVINCQLSESEWNHLPMFLSTSELIKLNLTDVRLTHLSPKPLQLLLVNTSDILMILNLEDCYIEDSQLIAFLPALGQCSQLSTFNFYGNQVSMSTLMDLLHHTARLRHLKMEFYPFPRECYDNQGTVQREKLAQHYACLMGILEAVRQPEMAQFATARCPHCGKRNVYNMADVCTC